MKNKGVRKNSSEVYDDTYGRINRKTYKKKADKIQCFKSCFLAAWGVLTVIVVFLNTPFGKNFLNTLENVYIVKENNGYLSENNENALDENALEKDSKNNGDELSDEDILKKLPNSCYINVKWVSQKPELPTGCEITSLTTVLNYYGYNVSKEVMADDYLEKGYGSCYKMFLGNPRNEHSFGCMAQPIVNAANKYFIDVQSSKRAVNVSGSEFETILEYVSKEIPMIVWNTIDMKEAYVSTELELDGEKYEWISPEHCVVVIGYNLEKNEVYVSDPWTGTVTRNLTVFKERYNSLNKQAVYINKN